MRDKSFGAKLSYFCSISNFFDKRLSFSTIILQLPLSFKMTEGVILYRIKILVEEARLLVLDAELTIDSGHDALYLTEGEHAAEEGIAGVVAV